MRPPNRQTLRNRHPTLATRIRVCFQKYFPGTSHRHNYHQPHYCPLCCYAVVSGRNRPLSENWIYNIELVNFYCNLEWMSVGRFFCLFFCTFPYVRPMTHIIYLLFATPTTMLHMVLRHATAHHTVRPLLWSRSWVAICFCQRPRQKIQAAVQCPH